jgi:hypothetical protein
MGSWKIIKSKRLAWANWMLLTLFFIGSPSLVQADFSDFLLKFYPYVTAQEEYSNNIFLSSHSTKTSDYITTTNGGLRFLTLQPGIYGIDLDASAGYNYYARHHDLSYWSVFGRLNSWVAATPRLTFRVRDYFIRSDQARENVYNNQYDTQGQYIGNTLPEQYLLSAVRGSQAIYYRNVVEPSMEYRFGRENLLSVLYRNNIYRIESSLYEDSMENTLNPRLSYWFDINNGVSLDYYFTWNTYQDSPDQFTNAITPRYTYRFNPRTSVFGEYRFEYQAFESPGIDYYVHNPSLGIQYQFSPTLVGLAQGGYYLQIPKQGSRNGGPTVNLSLTQRLQRTQYTLSFIGGYTEDYVTAENRGFTETYTAYGTVRHLLTQRLDVQLTGYMARYEYSNQEKAWDWSVRAGSSYVLFRWLTISMEGGYRGYNSNLPGNDYTEFRGIFRLTLARPGYQPGFMSQASW